MPIPVKLSRRSMLGAATLGSLMVTPPAGWGAVPDRLAVTRLQVNHLNDPLGLDTVDMRLSWQLASGRRGTRQVAYRIQISSSESRLRAGDVDIWDSGEISSDKSFDIPYEGPALASRQGVAWQVTVQDNFGQTATSMPAVWEMGLLSKEDWSANWVGIESPLMRDDRRAGLPWLTTPIATAGQTRQFRLRFHLDQAGEVILWTGANAGYRAFIDGQRIDLPAHSAIAMGGQGVVATRTRLTAGEHVLAASVDDLSGFGALLSGAVRCALFVRMTPESGTSARFSGRNAVASSRMPDNWNAVSFNDKAWSRAQLIGADAPWPGAGAFLCRRDLSVRPNLAKARLYLSVLGAAQVSINGHPISDSALGPEITDTRKTVPYRSYDVTPLLRAGSNTLAAMIGDGWYGSYAGPSGRYPFGDAPLRLLSQLELTYVDGSVERVISDPAWQISHAPITRSEIYDGEDYDARLEQSGWSEPGFQAPNGRWWSAETAPQPTGHLLGASLPPIRRTQSLKPKSLTSVADGQVLDFGQNFAGRVRIKVRGEVGDVVTLKFAEVLKSDGHVDQSNLRAARAMDTYILRGDPAGETYEPYFTYHGFRYVEISGLSSPLKASDVDGIVLHSDLEETGALHVGNAVIQQLWENTLWSQRSNFMGIPTDCPQRDERLGWMGDAHVFWDAAAYNMDVAAFSEKWSRDIRDAQSASGAYTDVSPDTIGLGDETGASPGWSEAGVIIPWTTWKRFGDTAIIDQNWEAMERYLAFIKTNSDDFIWTRMRGSDFGDWLALDAKQPGDPTTPKNLVATAMWKKSCDAMIDMAEASGRGDAVGRYSELSDQIKTAFTQKYVQEDGTVGNGSQTGYILALRYGLLRSETRPLAARKLVADIQRRGTVLSTGFLGTPPSLDVLADNGYATLVYDLLLRTTYPSWGYMVAKGATTIWERWNGDTGDVSMNSFNHYALGSVSGFAFRRIAGIDPLDAGFRRFRFDPVLDPRVTKGGGVFVAMPGRIATRWERDSAGRFNLTLDVPANVEATVYLPARTLEQVHESGHSIKGHADIRAPRIEDGRLALEVGSGRYRFAVTAS